MLSIIATYILALSTMEYGVGVIFLVIVIGLIGHWTLETTDHVAKHMEINRGNYILFSYVIEKFLKRNFDYLQPLLTKVRKRKLSPFGVIRLSVVILRFENYK